MSKYVTLSVRKEDLRKFKEISNFLQIKRVDLFHKVVCLLEKRVSKKEGQNERL